MWRKCYFIVAKTYVHTGSMNFVYPSEVTTDCTAHGHQAENGLGDEISFGGCSSTVTTAEESGIGSNDYDVIAFWEQVIDILHATRSRSQ